jgi:voltage-gated potassium channel
MILQTEKAFYNKFNLIFDYLELISVFVFSTEFLLRAISLKSIKSLLKPLIFFDLLAILPFYLVFLTSDLFLLRIFRLIKIFRIFKVARYSKALQNIQNIFISKKEELTIAGLLFFLALIISATLIYFAEGSRQECFSSIPKSLWWAVITFTSVGYGDTYPITALGKFIGSFVAILGVGIHGMFIGIIGSGLIDSCISKK